MSKEKDNLIADKARHRDAKRLRAIFNGSLTLRNRPVAPGFSMEETIAEQKRRAARQAAVQQAGKATKPGPKKRTKKRNNSTKNQQNKAA